MNGVKIVIKQNAERTAQHYGNTYSDTHRDSFYLITKIGNRAL